MNKKYFFIFVLLTILISLGSFVFFSRTQPKAYASAVIDNQASSNGSSTWSHTVGNSLNRILIVTATENVTAASFNNVPMTLYSSQTNNASASASIWYMPNPPIGTYTVRITGGTHAGSISLSNVNLATPFGVVGRAAAISYVDIEGGTYTLNELCRTTDPRQTCLDVLHVVTQVATASTSATMTNNGAQSLHWQQSGSQTKGGSMTPYTGSGVSGFTPMSWTLNGLGEGTFGWIGLTVPVNAVPLVPTGTPTPTPTLAPPPPPPPLAGGDITNLNFGIANFYPWIQGTCGNLRLDNGVSNPVPITAVGGALMMKQTASCASPGLLHGGTGPVSVSNGQISATNWLVGVPLYPEVYSSAPLSTSYSHLTAKAQAAGIPITNLGTVCTVGNCSLPVNLPSGVYHSPGNVTLQGINVLPNRRYIFLVGGDLLLQGNITIPQGVGSTATFASGRDILVAATVGVPPASSQVNLEGFYSAGRSFIINTAGNCNDLRLNIAGSIIANAARGGGAFQNNRDTCIAELQYPTVSISQRLDLLLVETPLLSEQTTITHEVAP